MHRQPCRLVQPKTPPFMMVQSLKKVAAAFGIRVSRIPSKAALERMEQARVAKAEAQRKTEELRISEAEALKVKWLRDLNIKTILDIGANTGQFCHRISQVFPQARIYCFEPLADCYEELVKNNAFNHHFQAYNVALGDEKGQVAIHRNEYSPSSSVLPMANLHKTNFAFAVQSQSETIQVERLDDLAGQLKLTPPILIKVDVQGFEDRVIRGGKAVFGMASVVICELSMEKLYEGQPLFHDLYEQLTQMNFHYKGNFEQLLSPVDGRVLQADGIFMRE